ncbi:MAG: dihydrodipicolinate synthase family protein [Acidobacteriota bacterium]|nr:dihydrodipicolinate synthase family protein [Acidobacteriota bacterium]
MKKTSKPVTFEGVIAAAVTPRRTQEYTIDLAATLELIDFLSERGVSGIALLGSTGEFVHFVLEDRARMLDFAVKRSRVPLIVNVSHSTLTGAIQLGQDAADSGAAALLLMPPYYFRYSQENIRAFYLRFAEELSRDIPVFLYNIPAFTSPLEPRTAVELLSTGAFAGIKDSSGDLAGFALLRDHKKTRNFTLLAGWDSIYAQVRADGADGMISGVASAVPELMVALDRAVVSGNQALTRTLDAYVSEFLGWFGRFPAPVAIKEATRLRGVKAGAFAGPLGPEGDRDLAAFGAWFREWLGPVLQQSKL